MVHINWWILAAGFVVGAVVMLLLLKFRNAAVDENGKAKSFLRLLMEATSQESSKRFVVVMTIIIFLIINVMCIITLWLIMFKLIPVPDATVKLFFEFFNNIIDYDAFLISFGIGATTVSNSVSFISAVLSKKADASIIAAQNKVAETLTVNKEVKSQTIQTDVVNQSDGHETTTELSKEDKTKEDAGGTGEDVDPQQESDGKVNVEEK